jgi:hypothetical protein
MILQTGENGIRRACRASDESRIRQGRIGISGLTE